MDHHRQLAVNPGDLQRQVGAAGEQPRLGLAAYTPARSATVSGDRLRFSPSLSSAGSARRDA